jgi:hypothetical protein
MKQFFDRYFWMALCLIFVFYFSSVFVYGRETASLVFLMFFALITTLLTVRKLHTGVAIAFVELFCNSHGAMIAAPIFGFELTLRMVIFIGVMLGWLIGLLFRRIAFQHFTSRNILLPFCILFFATIVGLLNGVASRDFGVVFSDGNAYLFFLYLLPILSIDWDQKRKHKMLQILAAGAVWVLLMSIVLLYVFSHMSEPTLRVIYTFLRDARVAEITILFSGVYRVFIQSQVFTIVFALVLFCAVSTGLFAKRWILMEGFFASVVILSLSRSFWFGVIPALVFAVVFILAKGNLSRYNLIKLLPIHIFACLFAFLIVAATLFFPFPARNLDSGLLADSFKDRTSETQDAAISSRWNLLGPMLDAILERPIIGSGFGKTVTFKTLDPRAVAENPEGNWTTYSMEWGWLELWLKMGILGPIAFLFLGFCVVVGLMRGWCDDNGWVSVGLASGVIFIFATHVFSPYLNHPIGIGFLLFCVPFFKLKKSCVCVLDAFEPLKLKGNQKELAVVSTQIK